ncbi:hypothetical protein BU23DRAFT_554130 [Bimuria novae-zelandiae CBS 107.79]|uniref:Uncharacterized protein n=1 Tax=Bimuria novae-zelandiae CBS 107.79 TaxID=1447943 RepID=A0A6A5V8Q2_9PLEO|nr:hypothetical protein BU23DRAFT_554130 [Bimuria novae-zelandiae CBS 107.79]
MSQINRPFRGFSGTFARPELPLEHPEIELGIPDEVAPAPTRRSSSGNTTPSKSQLSSKPVPAPSSSKLQTPSQAKKHLFTGIAHIFSHHPHHPTTPADATASSARPKLSRHAHFSSTTRLKQAVKDGLHHSAKVAPPPPCECKNQSDVVITYAKNFSDKERAMICAEIEQLYMATYTKAERRQFYRDAKRRESGAGKQERGDDDASCIQRVESEGEDCAVQVQSRRSNDVDERSCELPSSLASSLTTGGQGSVFTARSVGSSAASSICEQDAGCEDKPRES